MDGKRKAIVALVLAVAVMAVYAPVFKAQFISFDDPGYITENGRMRDIAQRGVTGDDVRWAFRTFAQGNWHPLAWLSLMADAQLWGTENPGRFHLTSVLLHALSTVLLFLVLARATGSMWRSALVAALFGVHPLHVESVAWVSERKDVLAGLFFVLALATYVWYVRRPGVGRYLTVAAMLALGLMAKPMLVTLPFVLLLVDVWPLGRIRWAAGQTRPASGAAKQEGAGHLILEKLPLVALSAASCVITFMAQQAGGAVAGEEALPFPRKAANALVSYVMYVEKTFCPIDLSFFYRYPAGIPLWQWAGAAAILVAVTVLAVLCIGRRPYLAVGWLWFVGMLVPVIGLVQVGEQSMADRYAYLPLVGLFIMIVWGVADLACRLGGGTGGSPASVDRGNTGGQAASATRPLMVIAGGAAVLACGVLAYHQAAYWTDTETLTDHALAINAKNHVAADVRAYYYLSKGDNATAAAWAEVAVAADDRFGPGWANLATARLRLGELDKAEAAAIKAQDVGYATPAVLSTLGSILAREKKFAEAEAPLQLAAALSPGMSDVHNDLAQVLIALGKADKAVAEAEVACRLTLRRSPMCLATLAAAYAASSRWDEAAATAREAAGLAGQLGRPDIAAEYTHRAGLYETHQTGR